MNEESKLKKTKKKKLELPIADRETKNEPNEYINNKSKSQRIETEKQQQQKEATTIILRKKMLAMCAYAFWSKSCTKAATTTTKK